MLPQHLAGDGSSSRSAKLQQDGINVAHWFQYLAQFAGVFYRAFPNTDLGATIDYVVRALTRGEPLDLLVFDELLARMGGFFFLHKRQRQKRRV